MTDFLDSARKEIEERLSQLREEVKRLEAAASALAGSRGASRAGKRSTATRKRRSTGAKRGRPRGSGTRSGQAHKLVQDRPGITIPELAKEMSISPNYLYRVLPQLQKDRKVRKRGKGWHPA